LVLYSHGQQFHDPIFPLPTSSNNPTDTLIPGVNFTPTLYPINSSLGYVVGTNAYNDRAKAQKYSVDGLSESYDLLGMMFWFGRNDPASAASITLNVYDLSGNGTGLNGGITAPSSSLYSQSFPLDSITTSEPNFVLFPFPIPIWYDYALGFDYSGLSLGDTIALLSSVNGEGDMDELAIELKNDGSWHSLLENWSNPTAGFFFDVNLALFPIIDRGSVGIEEAKGFHHFNNPASEELVVHIGDQGGLLQGLSLIDMQGREVLVENFSNLNASGDETVHRISLQTLERGQYILLFRHAASSQNYAEKLLIY
jgi:hypothetical protein